MNFWMVSDKIIYSDSLSNADFLSDQIKKYYSSNNIDIKQYMEMMPSDQGNKGYQVDGEIAIMPITGMIGPFPSWLAQMMGATSIYDIESALNEIEANENIKALYMVIDSPGGSTKGIYSNAKKIRELSKKKMVYAQVTGELCSAAYHLASGATKILASCKDNIIGSIGTKMVLQDDSKMLEDLGIKTIVIATGEKKAVGESGKEITEQDVEYLSKIVNELQGFFEESIKAGRPQVNIEEINDGGIMLAEEALSKKMIDGIVEAKISLQFLKNIL